MSLDFAIISTVEEFNALPVDAVVGFPIGDGGGITIYQRVIADDGPEWWCDGSPDPAILDDFNDEGILLWHPSWTIADFRCMR